MKTTKWPCRIFISMTFLLSSMLPRETHGGPLTDFPMTPEVRQKWMSLLDASGFSLAMEDIQLPTKPISTRLHLFRVFEFPFTAGGRDGRLTVHSQTGEAINWLVYSEYLGHGAAQRDPEEVRARIESIAAALLPPATGRVLKTGPQYHSNGGVWHMSWEAMQPGDIVSSGGYSISVFDSDLSLASYSRGDFGPKLKDMTVKIDAATAKQIAFEALPVLHKRVYGLDEAPIPEMVGEPRLCPAAYHPRFMETGCMERYDVRRERRLAWKVTGIMREDHPNGHLLVEEWYLHVDAKTGEVIGGSRKGIVLGPKDLGGK
jgi:hypothetical protein